MTTQELLGQKPPGSGWRLSERKCHVCGQQMIERDRPQPEIVTARGTIPAGMDIQRECPDCRWAYDVRQ